MVFFFPKHANLMVWYALASRPSTRSSPITTTLTVWHLFFDKAKLLLKAFIFSLGVSFSGDFVYFKAFLRLIANRGFLLGKLSPSQQWWLVFLLSFASNISLSLLPSSVKEFGSHCRATFKSRSPSKKGQTLDLVTCDIIKMGLESVFNSQRSSSLCHAISCMSGNGIGLADSGFWSSGVISKWTEQNQQNALILSVK